jgi:hypothetical protein
MGNFSSFQSNSVILLCFRIAWPYDQSVGYSINIFASKYSSPTGKGIKPWMASSSPYCKWRIGFPNPYSRQCQLIIYLPTRLSSILNITDIKWARCLSGRWEKNNGHYLLGNIRKERSTSTMNRSWGWEKRYHRENAIGVNKKQVFLVKYRSWIWKMGR